MSRTITIIGSLNTDLVTLTPRVPSGGETLTATSFSTGPGGKGANQAVACARLSRPNPQSSGQHDSSDITVKMVGAVGDDEFGPAMISSLNNSFVDTKGVKTIKNMSSGVAVILVEENTGENRILLSTGANHSLQPSDFLTADSLGVPLPDLIVLQLEIPLETVLQIIRTAKEAGVEVLLNPAPAVKLHVGVFNGLTHLIVNETEAAILTGRALQEVEAEGFDWVSVTDEFLKYGVKNVVVTLGGKGSYFSNAIGRGTKVEAAKVKKVVDTTAAGDTFVGVYAVEAVRAKSKGEGFNINTAVSQASRASGKTVEKQGAQNSIPWADEI
ncbi:ribokinase-like protein [Xylogone sp. PMI_703]|nr:ribokinase-like protein [Xylogone sp. PMI_703]